MEFEAEFAKSPLSKEYTDIFVLIAQRDVNKNMPSMSDVITDRVESEIRRNFIPSHALVADKRGQVLRDIPIIGDAMNVKQNFDLFNKFRKKNNK